MTGLVVDRLRIEGFVGIAKFKRDGTGPQRHRTVKAGATAGVAGARPALLDLDPDRVLIAVDPHLGDALRVAGTLTLLPEPSARARIVPGLAGLDGTVQSLGVHMGDHKHVAGRGVGRN